MVRNLNKVFIKAIEQDFLSLDIEFGNAAGFFSGHKQAICSNDIYLENFERKFIANIQNADLEITEKFKINNDILNRSVVYSARNELKLFDLVSRFVVLSNNRPAYIADKSIFHSCSNIYYQYPVKKVRVPLGDSNWLDFSDNNSPDFSLFDSVFYVRDEGVHNGMKKWIVHHRKIVKPELAKLIVRCCNPKFEGELPFQFFIPKIIKKKLFRIRELYYPNFPIMAIGEVSLSCDFKTEINTTIHVFNDEN